ncbi:hypothetical protein V8F06_004796 [Rhypophila decipiens]
MSPPPQDLEPAKGGILSSLKSWASNPLPPMGLATLITSLHYRPFQALPMTLTPLLVLSSYLSVAGFKIDSAGMTAAFSGMYVLLASRRRPAAGLRGKFSARGAVRGAAMGLGSFNCVAGGYTYATGDRKQEEEERREIDRWGMFGGK